ncbi:MAG: hypothetical protein M3355_10760, partial [Actinomycetota bacterium]|nr:hypothetical protein [Actinomycetota bacterium]
MPREPAEADGPEVTAVGQLGGGHDLRGRADSGDGARCQFDKACVDGLLVELEGGGDRPGVGASGGETLLVVGDPQSGEGHLGVLT